MKSSLSRKERRKIQQRLSLYGNLKKGAAVVGTVTAVSAVSPLLPVHNVHAEEADSSVVAPYDSEEGANDLQSQTDEPTTDYSNTEADEADLTQSDDSVAEDTEQPLTEGEEQVEQQPAAEDEAPQEQQVEEAPESEVPEDSAEDIEDPENNEEQTEAEELQEAAEQFPGDEAPAVAAFSSQLAPEPSAFIEELAGHAESVAASNDLYASVMIAQAVVESGWGSSTLSQAPNNNLFGIKGSYNGQSVTMPTGEYINGEYVTVNADFRKYPSYTASFQDNAALLSTGLYSGAWKSNTNSYKDATAALTGVYATAPNYNTVLNGVIEDYNLTRFDTGGSSDGIIDTGTGGNENAGNDNNSDSNDNSGNTETPDNNGGSSDNGSGTYTVQPGDSVWLIANKNGITMDQLRSWNNIQNDFVYAGQQLTVENNNNSNDSNNNGNSGNSGNSENSDNSNNNGNSSSNGSGTYTVKPGDSVWLIANNNGITMNQLRNWNNIQNDFVYAGQQLKVTNSSSSNNSGNAGNSGNTDNGNSSNNGSSTYTVKSGDSVWLIANNNGITMDQLRSWNNIQNNFVYPGQQLTVANNGNSNSSSNSNSNSSSNSNNNTSNSSYTVKSGDSVWLIANNNGITMDQLRSWNNIQNNFVYPGQKLTVKKGSASANNTNQTNSGSNSSHKVKSGDSLWMLSQEYDISISRLKSINNLSSDTIYIGQTLKVS
ncbi:MAG: LysM peptidoglycan-binding domain-containing protein [Tetragenococcus koreensis]|nr:LysM peptidoglycan-binding domain-containing protein [Tetragenococcus koreensis]MDN6664570.1 LysM peptidoglycan-binding domain-containing protein [Tetragenococcus koreensis]